MLINSSSSVAFLLHDVARLIRTRFDQRARALGTTRQQWRLLLNIARDGEGRTQAELADALDVERITLCRMIDRLAEAELVERRPDPADRRVWRIYLRGHAHRLVEDLAEIGQQVEQESLASLSSAERNSLVRSLEMVRDTLRAPADEQPSDVRDAA